MNKEEKTMTASRAARELGVSRESVLDEKTRGGRQIIEKRGNFLAMR